MISSYFLSFLPRFFVKIRVQVVVMNMFGRVFACRILVPASIIYVEPAGFTLIGEQNVSTVVPSEPSPHLLGKIPDLVVGLFVDPMRHRSVQVFSMGANLLGELSIESWENVIERKGVSCKMYPARVSSKDCECLTWPQSVALRPSSNIWVVLFSISLKRVQVNLP